MEGQEPAQEDDVVFVTYNPSKVLNRQNRKLINTFLGNVKKRKSRRTKFIQDRQVEAGKAASGTSGRRPPARVVQTSLLRQHGKDHQPWDLGHFIGGLRTDPFKSYPVEGQDRDPVTNAVDICKDILDRFCKRARPLIEPDVRLSSLGPYPHWTILARSPQQPLAVRAFPTGFAALGAIRGPNCMGSMLLFDILQAGQFPHPRNSPPSWEINCGTEKEANVPINVLG